MEDHDRLVRLAGALLSTFDWAQLMLSLAQTFDARPGFSARIWALGRTELTEIERFPSDAALPVQQIGALAEAGNAAEVTRRSDGTVFAPLRSLGALPMMLELHGLVDESLAFIDAVTRVLASRAAYLAAVEPQGRVLPALRGTEEVARAVRGYSTALQPLLRHDRLTIFLLTAGDRAIERFAVAGAVPLPDEDTITPISEFGLRDSLLRDRALLTDDIARDRAPHSGGARVLARAGFRSSLSVPLRMAGQRMGLLQFLSRTTGFYVEHDIRVAQDVADHAAPFVDHLRRQESVRPAALREAIETERTRLALDLGRVTRGALSSARRTVSDLQRPGMSADTLQDGLGTIAQLVGVAQCEISAAIADIAPPALRTRPFETVLRETLQSFGADHGLSTDLRLSGDPSTVSMTARRIGHGVLRAALAAARAGGATQISVLVRVEDELLLSVTDDGTPGQRHLDIPSTAPGELQTIAECAQALGGRLHTEYHPGHCTKLIFELPRTQPVRRDLEDERWLANVPESEPTRSLRVFVLDQQGVRRAGLTHFLDAQHELRVVGHAAAIGEARRSIGWLQPDVVFLDAEDDSAVETAREVHQASPSTIMVGLASRPGTGLTTELAAAGVTGVLPQNLERTDLLDAVSRLVSGESLDPGTVPRSDTGGAEQLNSRELAVLKLIAEGRTNSEIGSELYLAPKTIERHVAAVTRKVGARNRAHLVAVAIGRGLVRPPTA